MDSGRRDNQGDGAGERTEEDPTTAPLGDRRSTAAQTEPTITAPLGEQAPAAAQSEPTLVAPP